MKKQGRVITTDFKLVKVNPIALDADELALVCAAVDEYPADCCQIAGIPIPKFTVKYNTNEST